MLPVHHLGVVVYLFVIVTLRLHVCDASTSHFFAVTSPTYTVGREESVFVSIEDSSNREQPLVIDFLYRDQRNHKRHISTTANLTHDITKASSIGLLKFTIPEDAKKGKGQLALYTNGIKKTLSIKIKKTKSINNEIFIQTDKPVYKPGEKIRFRIIVIDRDLKPASENVLLQVYITNSAGSRIMQWSNVTLTNGLANLEIPISVKPVLGEWKIVATYLQLTKVQTVKVIKYVLPKFGITVKPSFPLNKIMIKAPIRICAKYTYGKIVTGFLNAKICLVSDHWRFEKFKDECAIIRRQINGCVDVLFDIRNAGYQYHYSLSGARYDIHLLVNASVTENSTSFTSNTTYISEPFADTPVFLKFVAPKYFKPGFPYKVKLLVTDLDGRPALNKIVKYRVVDDKDGIVIKKKRFMVKSGIHEFTIQPSSNTTAYYYKAKHTVKKSYRIFAEGRTDAWYSHSQHYVDIIKSKTNMVVGKMARVVVKMSSQKSIVGERALKYILVCKGRIVLANQKDISHSEVEIVFRVSHNMVPSCRLLVYYITKDGEFIAANEKLDFKMMYRNKVSMTFSADKKRPGEKVELILKASPGSQFALSAIDYSVQLLGETSALKEKQISKMFVEHENTDYLQPRQKCIKLARGCYVEESGGDGRKAVQETGLIYSSNAKVDLLPCNFRCRVYSIEEGGSGDDEDDGYDIEKKIDEENKILSEKKRKSTPRIRTHFPETWLWLEEPINSTGQKVLSLTVPDTITTWSVNGFAMSPTDGIGIASQASLKGFQSFFVSMALPYSVVRGESVKIPVVVFNYLDDCLVIQLSMEQQSEEHDMVSSPNSKMCVCGGMSNSHKFIITPKTLGYIEITVRATPLVPDAGVCGSNADMADEIPAADAMTKKLLVEAEGIKTEFATSSFFCPRDHGRLFEDTLEVAIQQPIVPGSVYAECSVVGDLMGPSMDNIDKLLAMPYGCGEQNMLRFAPNIYIMDYLTTTNQLTKNIENMAKEYMRSGYQRELTYKHDDGAYSAFGYGVGSTWLTAFVLKSYSQARRYIFIDDKDIEVSKNWLIGLQETSGCFKEVGMVHNKRLKGGVKSGITMSAFVVNALLATGMSAKHPKIVKALACITAGLDDVSDPYSLSILAYTLTLVGSSDERTKILGLLKRMENNEDGLTYWQDSNQSDTSRSERKNRRKKRSTDIETTAYALLSYIGARKQFGTPSDHLKIVKWLVKQRNSNGGFSSTQDTVVALMALSQFSSGTYSGDYALDITTRAPGFSRTFRVDTANRLLLQREEIPSVPVSIDIEASGRGCALVQVNVKYNIPKTLEETSFKLVVDVKDTKSFTCRHDVKICASFTKIGKTNMALMDVTMVSGFEPLLNELDTQTAYVSFNFYEFQDGVLSFYFDEFDSNTRCVEFSIEQVAEVLDRKPASVKIYDYYDTDTSATSTYEVGNCPEVNAV